jgi:ABC-type arginine transport system permease subunit
MKTGFQIALVIAVIIALVGMALVMASASLQADLSQEWRMWYSLAGTMTLLFSGIAIGICLSSDGKK